VLFVLIDDETTLAAAGRVAQEFSKRDMAEAKKAVKFYNRRQTVEDDVELPVVVVVVSSQKVLEVISMERTFGDDNGAYNCFKQFES
jgi:hypothetical protein